MNDDELSKILKRTSSVADVTRDQHIATALQNFDASQDNTSHTTRRSRNTIWSVAAAVLFLVGAGVGLTLSNLTDNDTEMYAEGNIETLGAMTTGQDTNDDASAVPTKGAPPAIGPCDAQYSDTKFVTIVSINNERVAIYATPTSREPIVVLVDPDTCGELLIAQG